MSLIDFCSDKVNTVAHEDDLLTKTTAGTQPGCRNSRVLVAGRTKLGDRQSSHLIKITASIIMASLSYGVAYPGARETHSTLNTKTGW